MLILLYHLLKNAHVDLGSSHLDLIRLGGQIIKLQKKHENYFESIDVVGTKKKDSFITGTRFLRKIDARFLHNMRKRIILMTFLRKHMSKRLMRTKSQSMLKLSYCIFILNLNSAQFLRNSKCFSNKFYPRYFCFMEFYIYFAICLYIVCFLPIYSSETCKFFTTIFGISMKFE